MSANSKGKPAKGSASGRNTEAYFLRKKAAQRSSLCEKSPALSQNLKRNDLLLTPSTSPSLAGSSSPSDFICNVCKGVESMRNASAEECIKNFVSQVDQLPLATNILKDSNSRISHFSDALKQFIINFNQKTFSEDFSKVLSAIYNVSGSVHDISNQVATCSDIEKLFSKYTEGQKSEQSETVNQMIVENSEKLSRLSL